MLAERGSVSLKSAPSAYRPTSSTYPVAPSPSPSAISEMHPLFVRGQEEGWHTPLSANWPKREIALLRQHSSTVIVHSAAHEQFCNIKELVEAKDTDLDKAGIDSYTRMRAWMRSTA
jgi:hypothetical protein